MEKHNVYKSFQEAFLGNVEKIVNQPEFKTSSRIGSVHEISGLTYEVEDLSTFQFENESIGRLDYNYADKYYQWMISGAVDNEALLKDYPNVAKFMEQLPLVKSELVRNPNTRRAVISIIYKEDLLLLDKDESLEFPCTDSATFFIRDGKLNVHLHMRSQNMGQVIKLDMYVWGRFTTELAKELNLQFGKFSCSIVSAHVFEKDFDYLQTLFPITTLGNVYTSIN